MLIILQVLRLGDRGMQRWAGPDGGGVPINTTTNDFFYCVCSLHQEVRAVSLPLESVLALGLAWTYRVKSCAVEPDSFHFAVLGASSHTIRQSRLF